MASKKTIGVLGGGQLCRMMGEEIARKALPFELIALDGTAHCPAFPFLKEQIVGSFKDPKAIRELAGKADLLTYEIELANSAMLAELEEAGTPVAPSAATLAVLQDKLSQRRFLKEAGLPVPDFLEVADGAQIRAGLSVLGLPCMLKARRDSYDGRGNYLLETLDEINHAISLFPGRSLMLERFVAFDMELSVIAARGTTGEVRAYPVGENLHSNNILRTTIVPARVSPAIIRAAEELALRTLEKLGGAGVFGIEMFLAGDKLLINEIAPRVHNSGHYTIEACPVSQFEQHLLAISGSQLGDTSLLEPAIMFNILGPSGFKGAYEIQLPELWPNGVRGYLHDYGKHESMPGRKIAHVTYLAGQNASSEALFSMATAAHSLVKVVPMDSRHAN